MKTRLVILVILLVFSLTCSDTHAQVNVSASSSLVSGGASGRGYQLTSLSWQVDGDLRNDRYQLLRMIAPGSSENGCCCVYLPCARR
jgi:hypothetical protein